MSDKSHHRIPFLSVFATSRPLETSPDSNRYFFRKLFQYCQNAISFHIIGPIRNIPSNTNQIIPATPHFRQPLDTAPPYTSHRRQIKPHRDTPPRAQLSRQSRTSPRITTDRAGGSLPINTPRLIPTSQISGTAELYSRARAMLYCLISRAQ